MAQTAVFALFDNFALKIIPKCFEPTELKYKELK